MQAASAVPRPSDVLLASRELPVSRAGFGLPEAFLCRGLVWRVSSESSRSALKECSSFPVTQQMMPTGPAVLIPSPSTE